MFSSEPTTSDEDPPDLLFSGVGSHCPDGLDQAVIEVLLADVYRELGPASKRVRPTSALLDGSAAERRRRRMARRAVSAVVRALPAHGGAPGPDGWAA